VIGDSETYVTAHTVNLVNLYPNTTYHYQIRSKTPVSQSTSSTDFTFTTPLKVFEIENYAVEYVSDQQAIFRWTTTTPEIMYW